MKRLSILLFAILFAGACNLADNPAPSGPGGNGNGNDPSYYFIDVPVTGTGGIIGDEQNFRVTNNGLFLLATGPVSSTVFRYDDGSASSFLSWPHTDNVDNIQPSSMDYDKREQLSYFFHSFTKSGFIGVNTGTPAEMVINHPSKAFNEYEELMLMDFSDHPSKWIFYRNPFRAAYVKWDNTNTTEPIISFPAEPRAVEPHPDDSYMYMGVGDELWRVALSGATKKISVPSGTTLIQGIQKIRVADDRVYFLAGSTVYSTDLQLGNLKSVYDIGGASIMYSFAVDGSYLYTSDGMKTPVGGGESVEIFNDASSSDIDYITARAATRAIAMDTHKGAGYVYYWASNNRVLALKK